MSGSPIYLSQERCVPRVVHGAVVGRVYGERVVVGGVGALSEDVKNLVACKQVTLVASVFVLIEQMYEMPGQSLNYVQ